jgi:hypothetical protein
MLQYSTLAPRRPAVESVTREQYAVQAWTLYLNGKAAARAPAHRDTELDCSRTSLIRSGNVRNDSYRTSIR